jgi:hypothetical protein
MLQRNTSGAGGPRAHAHVTHAAVVALHSVCCGFPALAMAVAALSGASTGLAAFSGVVAEFHHFLHAHELWILAVSASLVAIGAWLEIHARRTGHAHGIPWLFVFSATCLAANAALIFAHRG